MIPRRRQPLELRPGRRVAGALAFTLAGIALLASASRLAATSWGFMWEPPADPALQSTVLARFIPMADAGARMVRVSPGVPVPRTFVFWPGASPLPQTEPSQPLRFALATHAAEVYWDCRTRNLGDEATLRSVEVGNEPDLHFTSDLPDRMAATLKAAYWGMRARGGTSVLMPSLCSRPGPYAELLLANGIVPFTDAWNVHFYGWAHDLGDSLATHRRFLRAHGFPDLPIHVTEFGFAEFDATATHLETVQLRRQSTFFERSAAELVSSDVAAAWVFCLQPYTESGMDLGLHDAAWTPRPALLQWLAMAKELKKVAPRYRLRHRETGTVAGYAFERIGSRDPARWWVMLCSPHRRTDFDLPASTILPRPQPAPATSTHVFQLQLNRGDRAVLGLDGGLGTWTDGLLAFESSAATNLHLHVDQVPFRVGGCDWETVPAPSHRPKQRLQPSPVMVELFPDRTLALPDKSACAYRINGAEPVPVEIRLNNWGTVEQRGRVTLELPRGWEIADGSALSWIETVAPFNPVVRPHRLRRVASGDWDRAEIRVRWTDGDSGDVAQIRLAPANEGHLVDVPLVHGWMPGDRTSAWRIDAAEREVTCRLESGPRGGTPTLLVPIQRPLKSNSILRLHLRWLATAHESNAGPCRVRVELVTPGREVFRWGEETPFTEPVVHLACRVGDFTPAFWSRAAANDPAQARFVRLSVPGLRAGESIRFEVPAE